jgi:hypothetical protein
VVYLDPGHRLGPTEVVRISELGSVVDVNALVVMTSPGWAAIGPFPVRHPSAPGMMADSARAADRRACQSIQDGDKLKFSLFDRQSFYVEQAF